MFIIIVSITVYFIHFMWKETGTRSWDAAKFWLKDIAIKSLRRNRKKKHLWGVCISVHNPEPDGKYTDSTRIQISGFWCNRTIGRGVKYPFHCTCWMRRLQIGCPDFGIVHIRFHPDNDVRIASWNRTTTDTSRCLRSFKFLYSNE